MGKNVKEAADLKNSDISKHLNLPPVKMHCSMLAEVNLGLDLPSCEDLVGNLLFFRMQLKLLFRIGPRKTKKMCDTFGTFSDKLADIVYSD